MIRLISRIAIPMLLVFTFSLSAHAQTAGRHTGAYQLPPNATPSTTIVTFGIKGGNILPWKAVFKYGGSVKVIGRSKTRTHLTDPENTLNGIITLANAEGFFSMPSTTNCTGTLPDVASTYIAIKTTSGTKRVQVHGGCVPKFTQLADVLFQLAGVE